MNHKIIATLVSISTRAGVQQIQLMPLDELEYQHNSTPGSSASKASTVSRSPAPGSEPEPESTPKTMPITVSVLDMFLTRLNISDNPETRKLMKTQEKIIKPEKEFFIEDFNKYFPEASSLSMTSETATCFMNAFIEHTKSLKGEDTMNIVGESLIRYFKFWFRDTRRKTFIKELITGLSPFSSTFNKPEQQESLTKLFKSLFTQIEILEFYSNTREILPTLNQYLCSDNPNLEFVSYLLSQNASVHKTSFKEKALKVCLAGFNPPQDLHSIPGEPYYRFIHTLRSEKVDDLDKLIKICETIPDHEFPDEKSDPEHFNQFFKFLMKCAKETDKSLDFKKVFSIAKDYIYTIPIQHLENLFIIAKSSIEDSKKIDLIEKISTTTLSLNKTLSDTDLSHMLHILNLKTSRVSQYNLIQNLLQLVIQQPKYFEFLEEELSSLKFADDIEAINCRLQKLVRLIQKKRDVPIIKIKLDPSSSTPREQFQPIVKPPHHVHNFYLKTNCIAPRTHVVFEEEGRDTLKHPLRHRNSPPGSTRPDTEDRRVVMNTASFEKLVDDILYVTEDDILDLIPGDEESRVTIQFNLHEEIPNGLYIVSYLDKGEIVNKLNLESSHTRGHQNFEIIIRKNSNLTYHMFHLEPK